MKKILVILTAVFILSVSSCVSEDIQKSPVLHEDPSKASSQFALASLLSSYSMVFELLVNGTYANLGAVLADLKQANLSSEIKLLFDRYNQLSSELTLSLDTIESTLDAAAGLIDQGDLVRAGISLERAATLLSGIALVPAEISEVTSSIGINLGISALGAGAEIKLAYDRLVSAGSRLDQAVNRLAELEQALRERQNLFEHTLLPTAITLYMSPSAVFVGDEVKLSGRLTSLDTPLPERPLTLNFAGQQIKVTTDTLGAYSSSVRLPYSYVHRLTAQASYIPAGGDKGVYQTSISPDSVINVEFYQTSVEVSLPGEIHPGKQLDLNGRLFSDGEVTPRTLRVLLSGRVLATFSASDNFTVTLTPPVNLPPSTHRITLEVLSAGRYAGATKSSDTNLTLIPLNATVDVQGFVSLPDKLIVTGTVTSAGEATPGARVVLDFPDADALAIDTLSGIIAAEIPLALGPSFSGTRYLKITVNPKEPWYASRSMGIRVFVFNPLTAGGMLLICLALLLAGFIFSRKRPNRDMEPPGSFYEERVPIPMSATPVVPRYDTGGISGSIIKVYLDARKVISSLSGMFIAPGNTLREFLTRCAMLLPLLKQAFGELTELVEKVLYSGVQLGRGSLDKASEQARIIFKGDKRGNP
jgi:hypothetical protein